MQKKILKLGGGSDKGTGLLRRELFRIWWQATKPGYFMATLIPLVLAFIAAGKYRGMWEGLIFAGALVVAFALHLNANLCYHLFDEDDSKAKDALKPRLKDVFTSKFILQIVAGLYAFALLLTFVAIWITGLNALLLFVLIAMFSSFFYVAPPISLGHQGLGEMLVFFNLGIIAVCGTYYAMTQDFPLQLLALSIPVGAMVAMVIFYQSILNLKADMAAGRRSLATFFGPGKSVFLFTMAWPGIWLLLAMLWFCGLCSWQVLFGISLSIPFHMKLVAELNQLDDPDCGQGISKYFTYLMYLICGISLIVAVAYMVPYTLGV